jgi:hypothetical protein
MYSAGTVTGASRRVVTVSMSASRVEVPGELNP